MMTRRLEPEYMDTAEEADGYDAMDHSEPNGAFVERLVELGASGRMLDVGCGPGHIPPALLERVPRGIVVGIDAAATMLAHAERHRLASPHAARISYRVSDAKELPFEDGEFDAVFSNTVLHHIPEPVSFLREAGRVLSPAGVLLIRDLFRPETPERALELVALHASDGTAYQQELFRASLHAALTRGELRAMADEAGLAGCEIVLDTDRHMTLQRAQS